MKNRLSKLEKQMDKLTHEKETLEGLLAGPEIYEETNKNQLKELLQQQVKTIQALNETEEQWMQLSEELEDA